MKAKPQPGKKTFCAVLKDRGGEIGKDWYIEWYEGKKRRRKYGNINSYKTAGGRREAARLLMEELGKSDPGDAAPNMATKLTFYAALEARRPQLRRKSYITYKSKLNSLFEWLAGEPVTRANLKAFFVAYSKSHAQTTTYECCRMLKYIFELADKGHLLDDVKVRKGEHVPLRYFQPHQARRLADYLGEHDPELWLHCQFIYYCFLRPRTELRYLKVQDIYFSEKKIQVRGEISKNGKTQFVTIPDAFLQEVQRLQEWTPGAYVFPARNGGGAIGRNTLGERFRKVLNRMGFGPEYQLYSWKHTGAVALAQAGVSMKEIQMQLRHHSLDMVDRYLRQLGVSDMGSLRAKFPIPGE